MTTQSRKEVKQLLLLFKEALEYWIESIKTAEERNKIKSASVDDPLDELEKLSRLIKAHTTKVGIIFRPEVLQKEPEASYNTLQKLSESVVLMISIIAQLDPVEISQIFYDEILHVINELLLSNILLADELILVEKSIDSDRQQTDGRLVSVGKVWSVCDSLTKVLKGGKIGVLNTKFKQSIALIEDGLEEFEEWAENPEEFDGEDPFGFSDEDSEDEDEPPVEDVDSEERQLELQKVKEFSLEWLEKFKLIKLLFTSTSKSLPSATSGEIINSIYSAQKNIVSATDKLIVELMMTAKVSPLCEECSKGIVKNCTKLLKTVKDVNKSSESKVKWCEAWEAKFKKNL